MNKFSNSAMDMVESDFPLAKKTDGYSQKNLHKSISFKINFNILKIEAMARILKS